MPLPVAKPLAEAPLRDRPPEVEVDDTDDFTAAYMGGYIDQDRRPAEDLRLAEYATASTDAAGNWAATFDPVPLGIGWQGTISIPSARPADVFSLMLNSKQIGAPQGPTPWGPITALGGERVSITASGLAPNTVYQAVWLGIMLHDLDVPELVAPLPIASTVSAQAPPIDVELDYQSRTDYQPVYLGTAPPGTATSTPVWAIRLLSYDGSNRLTSILNAVGAWTNRTSLSYS